MNEVINNNTYKLKYWFAMLYIRGRNFMTGSVFTYQRLRKDFILCYFIKIWVSIFMHPKAVTDLKNALYYSWQDLNGFISIYEYILIMIGQIGFKSVIGSS